MEIPEEEIECSVRISWGPDTSENELKENLVKLIETAKQIKCQGGNMDPEMNMRIIYKICPENEDQGKLDQARALWRATVDIQIIYGCRITAPIGK